MTVLFCETMSRKARNMVVDAKQPVRIYNETAARSPEPTFTSAVDMATMSSFRPATSSFRPTTSSFRPTTSSFQPTTTSLPDDGVSLANAAAVDPIDGPFYGGVPNSTEDGLVTFIFLLLFALGAFLHLVRLIQNNKRRHRFLLSMPIIVFCISRTVYCIFRFAWAFLKPPFPRGVVAMSVILERDWFAVLLIPNLIIVRRIIRAMHPDFGWNKLFTMAGNALVVSIAPVELMSFIAFFVGIFAFGRASVPGIKQALELAASWNLMLAYLPLVAVFAACAVPGPAIENFGSGSFRFKTALLVFNSITLAVGQTMRLALVDNPEAALEGSAIAGKAVFYTTAFFLECLTVFSYLIFRFDNLYWVPDGSHGPGDYSRGSGDGNTEWTREQIKAEINKLGIRYELLESHDQDSLSPLYALIYPSEVADEGGEEEEEMEARWPSATLSTSSTLKGRQPPPSYVERSVERLTVDPTQATRWPHRRTSSWDSVDEAKMFI
ncbi:hypothetical protein L249_2571 [Ophiocordyceps polyrhachis-furcata BCC 54312]|uniref:Uncharacterized protein n=1 Tax=Ophiocordyceps polyrhachis-furcata BCC 54312 TaxID=1330021 RepID=A0A367LQH3_9HYPO|nr:hypothetical protein L249_2571 [Ophiocordyceps polyrhachis-furcata BCC 54312]